MVKVVVLQPFCCFLQIGGNRLCGELTDRQVNLWLPYGEAWELKYQAGSRYHGDYFGFRIQAVQNLCTTTTRSTPMDDTWRGGEDVTDWSLVTK